MPLSASIAYCIVFAIDWSGGAQRISSNEILTHLPRIQDIRALPSGALTASKVLGVDRFPCLSVPVLEGTSAKSPVAT